MSSAQQRIERVAHDALGFDALRPGQREAIESVLDGRDTLAVLATGSGKSAIYEISGLLIPGPTLVVSPLIALQRDQVEKLRERALGAAPLNSSVPEHERQRALAELADDALEFLFLAPEQLANHEVLDELVADRPSLVVIDEAHCISEWGHDFRPDYLRLGSAIEALGHPTVLALTATAGPPVREEIVARLGLRDPALVVRGFDRPNIYLAVERFHDEHHKREALVEHVAAAAKPGIVYAATRKGTEELAEALSAAGVRARAYHAGLRKSEREEAQRAFMDSELEAMVATTAFGMGVDKPDVRWVLHAEVPESVDAYYQELGRAGRDGEPAEAILFYRTEDLGLRRFFAGGAQLDLAELEAVAETVAHARRPVSASKLQERTELTHSKLDSAVLRLQDAGAVDVLPTGRHRPATRRALGEPGRRSRLRGRRGPAPIRALASGHDARLRRDDRHMPARLPALVLRRAVRAAVRHLRQLSGGSREDTADRRHEPFPVGARVVHPDWGEGAVQRYDGHAVVVLFDDVGYKTLALAVVAERGLLTAT